MGDRTRWVVRVGVSVLLAALLAVGGVAVNPQPAVASDPACPPNSTDTSVISTGKRCVAELLRSVRGHVQPSCVTSPKALSPRNPLYTWNECKLGTLVVQAEAIAEARLLARLNVSVLFGDSPAVGGITANAQWQVAYPKPPDDISGGRVDVMVYDRDNPSGIELVELKQRLSASDERDAINQVNKYQRHLPAGGANRSKSLRSFAPTDRDFYRFLVRDCNGSNSTRLVYQYEVKPSTLSAGVLVILRQPQLTDCPKDGEPPLDPVAEEEPIEEDIPEDTEDPYEPPILIPRPGSDDDGDGWDDFYDDLRRNIPEFDYPRVPVEEPISTGTKILIGTLAAAAVVACLTIFAEVCVAALAGSEGAATLGSLVATLGTLLAGLVGWNIWGDPHLVTLDKLQYDLQSVGEFHLLELPDASIDVQARFRPWGSNLSVLDRIATEINDHRIEIGNAWVKVDGSDVNLAVGGAYSLGEGAFVARDSKGFMLLWPRGLGEPLALLARGNSIGFAVPPGAALGQIRGLLGNHDGNPNNDLALRDGTQLPANATSATLHGVYADSWRVSDDESLFGYASTESTATFTDRSAPQNVVTTGDFSETEVTAATTICADAGVEPGPQFDACVLDVLVTGDTTFADAAALVTDVLVSASALEFDVAGRLSVDFEGTVPPNFVASRYSTDAATSRIAGPVFDQGGYRFYVRNVGRHDGASLETDIYAFGPVTDDGHAQSVDVTINKQQRGSILFDGGPPRLSDGMAGTLAQTGSGVTAAGQPFTRFHLEVPLGRVGESLDTEFAPHNFDGVLNTAVGFDDIELTVDVPPAQRFTATEPLSSPGSPGSGMHTSDGAGVLESPGASDIYEFEVPSSQADKAHVINTRSCGGVMLTFTLTNKDTGAQVGRWPRVCWRVTTPDLAAGTYELAVTPYASAAAGSYSMELFVRPEPQPFDYSLGSTVRNGEPVGGAGNLETVASQDVYTFHTNGGSLFMDHRACFPSEERELRTHDTSTPVAHGYCVDRALNGLTAGDYDLAFTSGGWTGGTYSFQLFATPVLPQDFATTLPLTVGDQWPAAGAGNLETQQSVDRYAFTVGTSAPLYIDTQVCLDGGALTWTLLNTVSGSIVDSGDCTDKEISSLPAGDYRLDIASANQGVGVYELQAWLVPMPPQAFTVSVPATISPDRPTVGAGNLETKASQDIYSFSLPEAKTALYLDQIDCSTPGMLTWRLVNDVNGIAVTVANGTCEDRQIRQVAQGDYRLEVTAVGEHHGTYSLRIVASDTGSPSIVHVPQTTAYHGQPIPIDVTTTCTNPSSCFAKLFYRTSRTSDVVVNLPAGAWTMQELTLSSSTPVNDQQLMSWHGAIPGAAVTTTGVDYYVTAGDGDNRNELPTAPPAPLGFTGDFEVAFLHVTTVSPPLLAHVTPVYAQADKNLPLELKASCSTGSCTARLHYRTSAGLAPGVTELVSDPGWPTITMTQTASAPLGDAGAVLAYSATIPGSQVDTRGVDYYFDVTDGHTTTYWPGTTYQGYYAPVDGMRTSYQTIHVLEPPHIVHVPVTTTPYRAMTPITATANCPSTRACTARLYYRATTGIADIVGDNVLSEFSQVDMSVTRVTTLIGNDIINVAATIPAAVADTRGIDYFFRIDDGSTTTWFPGTGQVQGYVNVDGTRVAYQHIRVLEPPHIASMPVLTTKALQPYTITSRMTCATEHCAMTLHWRNDLAPGEPDPGWHDVPMTETGDPVATAVGTLYTYTYTIPAEKVTTRGLAYYLEGYDGYVHDYSPGTSYWGAYLPLDGQHLDTSATLPNGNTLVVGSFLVRVLEPPHLVHAPPGLVEKGQPLTLTATSNCSSSSCPATLTWTDHEGNQQTVPMTAVRQVDDDTSNPAVPGDVWQYSATIPAADTNATVLYSMSVTDSYTSDATPALQALVYENPAAA